MKRELIHSVLVGILLFCLTGCVGMPGKVMTQDELEKRQKLAKAVDMIRAGLDSEARYFLELAIDDPREDGVTDEALFRLAILKLNDGEEGDAESSIALIDKLRSSYPASTWTGQAAPLYTYLLGVKALRSREREFKTLRERNLSLSRDVTELRQTIERLKALDRELEQKIRR